MVKLGHDGFEQKLENNSYRHKRREFSCENQK